MIEHLWSVLCTRAIVDRQTNSLSLVDVLEQIQIDAPPPKAGEVGLVPMQHVVATLLRRSELTQPAEGQMSLLVQAPDGTTILDQTRPANLMEHERLRVLTALRDFPVKSPGTYRFIVKLRCKDEPEWQQVASIPFEVVFRVPPELS